MSDYHKQANVSRRLFLRSAVLASGGALLGRRALAADQMNHDHHAHHRHAVSAGGAVKRSEVHYRLPALRLVRDDGSRADFPAEIDDGRPVILNFIYTSCTTICPLTSQVFSKTQGLLGKDLERVHLMSISIDPEYDTPQRLRAYAKTYHASSQWQLYTGTVEASMALQKAFDAYRGDKMNHVPLTFFRPQPGKAWVRLDGFATPDDVVREFRRMEKRA